MEFVWFHSLQRSPICWVRKPQLLVFYIWCLFSLLLTCLVTFLHVRLAFLPFHCVLSYLRFKFCGHEPPDTITACVWNYFVVFVQYIYIVMVIILQACPSVRWPCSWNQRWMIPLPRWAPPKIVPVTSECISNSNVAVNLPLSCFSLSSLQKSYSNTTFMYSTLFKITIVGSSSFETDDKWQNM